MMKILTALRRAVAWFVMRSIEARMADISEALETVRDELTREDMFRAMRRLHAELARARAEYQSFLPPGERITWSF